MSRSGLVEHFGADDAAPRPTRGGRWSVKPSSTARLLASYEDDEARSVFNVRGFLELNDHDGVVVLVGASATHPDNPLPGGLGTTVRDPYWVVVSNRVMSASDRWAADVSVDLADPVDDGRLLLTFDPQWTRFVGTIVCRGGLALSLVLDVAPFKDDRVLRHVLEAASGGTGGR